MTRKIDWLERHKRAAQRKPWIRLDRLEVKSLGPRKGYAVTIEGFNLRLVIPPPVITVGGVPLERMKFHRDGRVIRGFLATNPPNRHLIVDFRIARAEIA